MTSAALGLGPPGLVRVRLVGMGVEGRSNRQATGAGRSYQDISGGSPHFCLFVHSPGLTGLAGLAGLAALSLDD